MMDDHAERMRAKRAAQEQQREQETSTEPMLLEVAALRKVVADLVTTQGSLVEQIVKMQAPTEHDAVSQQLEQLQQTMETLHQTANQQPSMSPSATGSLPISEQSERLEALLSRIEAAAAAIGERPAVTLKIDEGKVAMAIAERTLTSYDTRVLAALEAQEARLAALGQTATNKAAERIAHVTGKAHTSRALRAIADFAQALLPLVFSMMLVAFALLMLGEITGVGPIFNWLWAYVGAAEPGWRKAGVAAVILVGVSTPVVWVTWLGAKEVSRKL